MAGLLDALRGRGVLSESQPQGVLSQYVGAPPTTANSLMSALSRLPSALFQPGYMQEPTSLAADLGRKAFWRGSVMGMPDGVKQRDNERAVSLALMAAPAPKYGISHRPMQDAGGAARLHDLLPAFGDDIYGPNALQYFGSGDAREKAVVKMLSQLRGKPDAEITVYRGLPADAQGAINPGDWVTLSKQVAADYGPKVVEMRVPASHITSWADSLLEFGYYPPK